MNAQLPLVLRWPAHQRLAGFVPGANALALELVRRLASEPDAPWLYLGGVLGSGRSHLLVAACAAAQAAGRSAQYLPLARVPDVTLALRGCGGSAVLAIDDVDAIAGRPAAEQALFDLYNRCRSDGAALLFAASAPSAQLGIALPDLVSRLAACTQLTLKPLDEAQRRALLRDRARQRGLELDEAVLDWLFTRRKRDLGTLLEWLERIDRASLASQRRVTVPFVRALGD
ncbi:MAG: DnaA regulatory inactivator Hda [Dokdonella sp.]|nr:DnaA regulatory inactivator Hda [Dokdonella sp.]